MTEKLCFWTTPTLLHNSTCQHHATMCLIFVGVLAILVQIIGGAFLLQHINDYNAIEIDVTAEPFVTGAVRRAVVPAVYSFIPVLPARAV